MVRSFIVMARLVRTIGINTTVREMARSSRAMTKKHGADP
jgi:hypothetical protein